jgi:hypothetical protein
MTMKEHRQSGDLLEIASDAYDFKAKQGQIEIT